jgi:hypothetical protein
MEPSSLYPWMRVWFGKIHLFLVYHSIAPIRFTVTPFKVTTLTETMNESSASHECLRASKDSGLVHNLVTCRRVLHLKITIHVSFLLLMAVLSVITLVMRRLNE